MASLYKKRGNAMVTSKLYCKPASQLKSTQIKPNLQPHCEDKTSGAWLLGFWLGLGLHVIIENVACWCGFWSCLKVLVSTMSLKKVTSKMSNYFYCSVG